jgi:hypothetical protein
MLPPAIWSERTPYSRTRRQLTNNSSNRRSKPYVAAGGEARGRSYQRSGTWRGFQHPTSTVPTFYQERKVGQPPRFFQMANSSFIQQMQLRRQFVTNLVLGFSLASSTSASIADTFPCGQSYSLTTRCGVPLEPISFGKICPPKSN